MYTVYPSHMVTSTIKDICEERRAGRVNLLVNTTSDSVTEVDFTYMPGKVFSTNERKTIHPST